ncbi:6-carboxytetrahydropterin synthase QueD [Litoribacter ruber]|uniref:6-carboxy-5,6,7,8-tetrahydropterin synthase n=1 Tax=Litoribacter ruber TaxID=702568 RepID=A0AAP2CM75_9BACT|nr:MULTISPECIES: 6-carboxytetrahydropterin synthase QueD [Litoribacter]MBS9524472.1 6-carboxytetrahydropterin synthase QueD [Litoribacter alkaliphilus]MBT0810358.1 6-carboxytetrahydropterin synthase QueD [Litoribacter ruber]
MLSITKIFEFEAAHRISNYNGACKFIHGHTYKLHVTLTGNMIEGEDMVMDFKKLKNIVRNYILEPMDHALILKDTEENRDNYQNTDGKIFWMNTEPTAERMILWMADILIDKLPDRVRLQNLKLYETSTSFAEWSFGPVFA